MNTGSPHPQYILGEAPLRSGNHARQPWSYNMGTSRIALGAVFGTINEAATSVSSLFGTATKSINMLNKYVSDVSERQALRSIVDTHSYKKSLIEEKTMETTMRKLEVKSFCAQSPHHAELYQATYDEFAALFETG
jgi:hypothetical protein